MQTKMGMIKFGFFVGLGWWLWRLVAVILDAGAQWGVYIAMSG